MFQPDVQCRRHIKSRSDLTTTAKRPGFRSRRVCLEHLEPKRLLTAYSIDLASKTAVYSHTAGGASSIYNPRTHFGPVPGIEGGVISQDGRYVAFVSSAANLVAGANATPNTSNVYRFDRQTGNIVLVSMNSAGLAAGNGSSDKPLISADGNVVAFSSSATDLTADQNPGLFARNISTGITYQFGGSSSVAAGISADGNVVAFQDGSSISVFNLSTQVFTEVTVNSSGNGSGNLPSGSRDDNFEQDNPYAGYASQRSGISLSADGTMVAFRSDANNLATTPDQNSRSDVYVRNLTTGTTTLVSVNVGSAGSANGNSYDPLISADGKTVTFVSQASDLTTTTDSNGRADVFTRNLITGVTSLVSVDSTGTGIGNGDSYNSVINADGSVVAFESKATNLQSLQSDNNNSSDIFVRNLINGTTLLVSQDASGTASGNAFALNPTISADGSVIAYLSYSDNVVLGTLAKPNVYARNMQTNTNYMISVSPGADASGNAESSNPSISADGSVVAFSSFASNLTPNDLNVTSDVFVRDLAYGVTTPASKTAILSDTAGGTSEVTNFTFSIWTTSIVDGAISADGRYVAFASTASNLIPGMDNPNGNSNIYRLDRRTNEIVLVSVNADGTGGGNGSSSAPVISADGNVIAFGSGASDLTAVPLGISAGYRNVFARNLSTNTTYPVSINASGTSMISGSSQVISADGSVVAFSGFNDVFARNLLTGIVYLVSANTSGTGGGNGTSMNPSISADGQVVVYQSYATNLQNAVPDTNGELDIFARNLTTGVTKLVTTNAAGTAAANRGARDPVISANGNVVTYHSNSNNLTTIPDGNPLFHSDIFARNLTTNTTYLVSINSAGTASGNVGSGSSVINADGTIVAFNSDATNLTADMRPGIFKRNLTTGVTTLVNPLQFADSRNLSISADGQVVAYGPISADGSVIAFQSSEDTLANGDFNSLQDVFIADSHPIPTCVTVDGDGNLVVADTSTGGKNDKVKISYNSPSNEIVIEDLNGTLFDTAVGTGNGSATITIPLGAFAGKVVFNADRGDDALTVDASFGNSGKQIEFNGGSGDNSMTTALALNPATINSDLQGAVSVIQGSSTYTSPPQVTIPVDSTSLASAISAVQSLTPSSNTVEIVLKLSDGNYSGQTLTVPKGVRLVIDGTDSVVTFDGHSPALTVTSGDLVFDGAVFSNTTDAPTILVTGGTLTLRNSLIQETTGGTQAAIQVTGGTVDLGTAADPGGNTIEVRGPGLLISNTSSAGVSAVGNTFDQDGAPLASQFAIEDFIYHGLDQAGLGIVRYAASSLAVTVASGNLQRGIDAAQPGDTVYVQSGVPTTQGYKVGQKLLSVAFENGPTISQQFDSNLPGLPAVVVTGTSGNDSIEFSPGNKGQTAIVVNALNKGTFSPYANVRVIGGSGNDTVKINASNQGSAIEIHAGRIVASGTTYADQQVENRVINGSGKAEITTAFDGAATVDGGGGADTIVSAATGNSDWYLTAGNTGNINGQIFFSNIGKYVGGPGADTFHLGSGGSGGELVGGDGADTIIGSNSANTWNFTAASGGSVGDVTFSGIETVLGGAAADTFKVSEGVTFAGTLLGGAGSDTLDYSACHGGVRANLLAGTATGTASVSGIENVTGGDGDDDLVGNATDNVLSGGKGNDILVGGAGNDQLSGGAGRNVLIGGTGADQLGGASEEDILIAGTTSFDANDSTLLAILNEWSSSRTYAQRVANLLGTGTGASFAARLNSNYFLNVDASRGAITVFDDNAQDSLKGGGDLDLYFANLVLDSGDHAAVTDKITGQNKNEIALDIDF